ncbi:hypothetical protein A3K93_00090 [Acinetobacter sp. NCu2D-2]|uniref:hypothetical protein n=1 Tax=Acinetobacter sp. NCu2D-2 TaxID=1608473 RepID=UPI0007CDD25D|nr:hypothetical protein [Acinetobacter sp. NCu2D-2]ANF80745.1 hypothetical protein A3K93_00090 [Acinetobacter sp. NCu2D-2]
MNIDWNLLIACFSAIAASTASLATFLGWKENRELRRAQTDPFIDVKLECVDHHIHFLRLKITNIGKGSAFNVRIKLSPHFSLDKDSKKTSTEIINIFNKSRFMEKGINYLSTFDFKNTNYISLLGGTHGVNIDNFLRVIIIAKVEFYDVNNKKFFREFEIDASEMQGTYKLGKTLEEAIPKALDGIHKSLGSISKNIASQTKFLNKDSSSEKTHWNYHELKQTLKYMEHIKHRNRELGIETDEDLFKKIERRLSIHEIRKQNK